MKFGKKNRYERLSLTGLTNGKNGKSESYEKARRILKKYYAEVATYDTHLTIAQALAGCNDRQCIEFERFQILNSLRCEIAAEASY